MKKISAFLVLFAAAVMFMATTLFFPASAATVLPTDSSTPRPGCTFLGIEGKYITQIQESIDLINKIRLEACEEGVVNPATGKPLTKSDYVPIQWSADLEYIARIRAAEASVTMDHARTNGQSIWFKSPNGIQSYSEVIAWNWRETMTDGIQQWYGEKNDWVNKTGGVTGHYTAMINPNNRYVGLGTFYSKVTTYNNTTVGEFCGKLNNPDTSRGSSTGYIIQTLEVKNDNISYYMSGSDSLTVNATVTFNDYWSHTLKTKGLTLLKDAAGKIQWSSSNNNIVSVSNGKLTVKLCGSATITAKLPDGTSLTKPVSYQHSYETKTTEATCNADGKIVKKCKICSDTNTQVIPKTNQHTFGNWVTTKAPTASSDGLETRTCAVCSIKETRTLQFGTQGNHQSDVNDSPSESSSAVSSGEKPSVSSSGEKPSISSSGENSSVSSSGEKSSVSSSGEKPSVSSSGENSSVSSSNESSPAVSSGDETHIKDTSGNNASKIPMPIVIIACVLLTGAVVLVICLVIKRKRK